MGDAKCLSDCPEDRPLRTVGGLLPVYSLGSLPAFYRLEGSAPSPDVAMAHARPTVHPDGSL